jgi:rubrerythrin
MYGAKAAKLDKNLVLERMLTYAIQDEYLAREEYDIAIKAFGEEKPFTSIINSEVSHINWLRGLFEKYALPVPEDKSREFLHTPENFRAALDDGVQAEIENIEMYDNFLLQEIPEEVKSVFTKLRDASKGHLLVLKRRLETL